MRRIIPTFALLAAGIAAAPGAAQANDIFDVIFANAKQSTSSPAKMSAIPREVVPYTGRKPPGRSLSIRRSAGSIS